MQSIIKGLSSDSGRSESELDEKRDCCVRAYAAVKGISYKQAHCDLWLAGRKMRRGFRCQAFYTKEFGNPLPRPQMVVENYVKFIAHTGKWIIEIRGHVFAVIDGTIIDLYPQANHNRNVVRAWKVKD